MRLIHFLMPDSGFEQALRVSSNESGDSLDSLLSARQMSSNGGEKMDGKSEQSLVVYKRHVQELSWEPSYVK